MPDKLMTTEEGSLQRGLSSVWQRIAPLGIGSVVSSAAIIAASAVLRRALGPKARLLGWAGTLVVIPLGIWALSQKKEEPRELDEASAGTEQPPSQGDTKELENT